MAQNDLTNTILEERMEVGYGIAEKIVKKFNLKVSDFEKLDIATRLANALFIEKNKSYRASQIQRV